jgi:hypothetical protein
LPDIFGTSYQNRNVTNDHKIYQIVIKYPKYL